MKSAPTFSRFMAVAALALVYIFVLVQCGKRPLPVLEPLQDYAARSLEVVDDYGTISEETTREITGAFMEGQPYRPYLVHPDYVDMEMLDGFEDPMLEDQSAIPRPGYRGGVTRAPNFNSAALINTVGSESVIRSIIMFPEGDFLMGGRTKDTVQNDFQLTRHDPSGWLDPTFGTQGISIVDMGPGRGNMLHAIATDSSGKIVAAGRYNFGTAPLNYFVWAAARYNANGTLDTTFGTNGTMAYNLNSLNGVARAVLPQNDNKIVLVGYQATRLDTVGPGGAIQPFYHRNYNFAVARLNTNGTLDTTSFGTNGVTIVSLAPGQNNDGAFTGHLESNGKILAGGYYNNGTNGVFAVARFLTNGTLDTAAYGTTGRTLIESVTGKQHVLSAIDVTDSNTAIVAGYMVNSTGNSQFAVARLRTNGQLDSASFGTNGWTTVDMGANRDDYARAIAIQTNGKAVVVGQSFTAQNNFDMAVIRLNTNGTLDTTPFPATGKVTLSVGNAEDSALAVGVQDDAIFVAGRTFDSTAKEYYSAQVRLNNGGLRAPSGSLDLGFGAGTGQTQVDFNAGSDIAFDIATTKDNKILVGGSAKINNIDFGLIRLNADGSLDTATFGSSTGKVTTTFSRGAGAGSTDQAYAMALANDEKIYLAGRVFVSNYDFGLARFTTNGLLDTAGFGTSGRVTTSFPRGAAASSTDEAWAIAVQTDGKIILGGRTLQSNNDFAMARYTTNGTLDTAFNGTGRLIVSWARPSGTVSGEDNIYAMIIQPDGKILAGGTSFQSDYEFALLRVNSNGSIDTSTFGTNGKVLTTFNGSSTDEILALALQTDGKILAAGHSFIGSYLMSVVRYQTNGVLDSAAFNGNGRVLVSFTANNDDAYAVRVMSDGRIMLAGRANNADIGVARLLTNGTLDTTFNSNGKVRTSFGAGTDGAFSIATTPSGRLIIGGRNSNPNNDFAVMRIFQ